MLKVKNLKDSKLKIQNLIVVFLTSARDLVSHNGIEHAGYISFLLMVTICPFLLFLVSMIGFISSVYLQKNSISLLIDIILNTQLTNFIDVLKPRIIEITNEPPKQFLTLAVFSIIWTASSIFDAIKTILNRAYRVTNPPRYILRRLFSVIEFLVVILAVGLTFTAFTLLSLIFEYFTPFLPYLLKAEKIKIFQVILKLHNLQAFTLWVFAFLSVSYLYCFLPNKKQKFTQTFPGTIITLFGWLLCSISFKYYIVVFPQINLIYGSIAGIIITLLYFYLCSIVFVYGAEFNYHYNNLIKRYN